MKVKSIVFPPAKGILHPIWKQPFPLRTKARYPIIDQPITKKDRQALSVAWHESRRIAELPIGGCWQSYRVPSETVSDAGVATLVGSHSCPSSP